jgi:hypothetical protein
MMVGIMSPNQEPSPSPRFLTIEDVAEIMSSISRALVADLGVCDADMSATEWLVTG